MKMSNIRPNFSAMNDTDQRQFFWNYCDKRANDFSSSHLVTVKTKKTSTTSSKEPKLTVTPAQLQLLKALGLV